jgi:hypothetical protein
VRSDLRDMTKVTVTVAHAQAMFAPRHHYSPH